MAKAMTAKKQVAKASPKKEMKIIKKASKKVVAKKKMK